MNVVAATGTPILNDILPPSIFATPSTILRAAGSVGGAFTMWLVGALIAAAGTMVYMELGTGLPRSGGEKNYLEYIYRRPKYFVTCAYATYAIITGSAAANSVVFGSYITHALALEPTRWTVRTAAFLVLTFCFLIHGTCMRWGVRLQNALGMFKLIILTLIVFSGMLALTGGYVVIVNRYERPDNFRWATFWEGSGTSANAYITGLYNVIWSFVGYSNANYALSEIRDPVRTLKRAAPIAVASVTTMYFLINVAYFAVISKRDILESRQIVAALYFRNLFGATFEKALSAFISLSTLGNLLAGQFVQGRVIQELGREGVLPFSEFFASNEPFGAPFNGLFTQWFVSCTFILAPPPGDAYLFIISLSSYSYAIINTLVSVGLLLLYLPSWLSAGREWKPPYHAPKLVILLFFLSNIFLIVVPWIPPTNGTQVYEHLPYFLHALVALSVSLLGATYWYVRCVWLPRRGGYTLQREWVHQDDGTARQQFRRVIN
ncbi:APC amino acid permease [Fistulina hepatica ATCC 64428]|uniref:APC amino acid permease n=1 Tax=Fistulina hepatica ATCC 64428 TaxID=1128425 RepID=A0A0D7APH9_9AGAR|nr:APC amino acid permease [Fistulina hepatica ATCC 64428]